MPPRDTEADTCGRYRGRRGVGLEWRRGRPLVGWRVQGCCDRLDRLDQHAVRVGDDVCVEEPVRPTCVETRGDQRGDVSTKAWCGWRRGERCRCRIV